MPEKRSFESKHASFKNIKFPRRKYQTDSSETLTLVKYNKTLFTQGSPFSSKAGVHRGPVSKRIIIPSIIWWTVTFKKPNKKYNNKVMMIKRNVLLGNRTIQCSHSWQCLNGECQKCLLQCKNKFPFPKVLFDVCYCFRWATCDNPYRSTLYSP